MQLQIYSCTIIQNFLHAYIEYSGPLARFLKLYTFLFYMLAFFLHRPVPCGPLGCHVRPVGPQCSFQKKTEKLKETLENPYSLHSNTYIATKKPLTTIAGHDIFESGTADRDFQKSLLFVKKTCYENIRLWGSIL